MTVHPAKTQISLGIRPAWSESLLSTWRKLGFLATHWAHSKDWSDWVDAQADLSLRWAHMPFCWFCYEVVHIWSCRAVLLKCKLVHAKMHLGQPWHDRIRHLILGIIYQWFCWLLSIFSISIIMQTDVPDCVFEWTDIKVLNKEEKRETNRVDSYKSMHMKMRWENGNPKNVTNKHFSLQCVTVSCLKSWIMTFILWKRGRNLWFEPNHRLSLLSIDLRNKQTFILWQLLTITNSETAKGLVNM